MRVSGKRQFDFLKKIGYVRMAGTPEELQAANTIADEVRAIGFEPVLEAFEIDDAKDPIATLEVLEPYKKTYTVTGYKCQKSTPEGGWEGDFIYAEDVLDVNLVHAKDKFVLVNGRVTIDKYKKLLKAGVAGFITMGGDILDKESETDLDVMKSRKLFTEHGLITGLHIRIKDGLEIVKKRASRIRVTMINENEVRTSHNVCVTVPGTEFADQIISFGAHYDSVRFSSGVYDNGTGTVILLELLRYFKENPPKRTLQFNWYGSEEIGLEGSKNYIKVHEEELEKHVLMINLDMAGPYLGKDTTFVTAEESLVHFTDYYMKANGYAVEVKQDIYSSDNMPFADQKIPAISFTRFPPHGGGHFHSRYDMLSELSPKSLARTTEYVMKFSDIMANAVAFPVPRTMPENMVEKIDKYLFKKEFKELEEKKEKEKEKETEKEK